MTQIIQFMLYEKNGIKFEVNKRNVQKMCKHLENKHSNIIKYFKLSENIKCLNSAKAVLRGKYMLLNAFIKK